MSLPAHIVGHPGVGFLESVAYRLTAYRPAANKPATYRRAALGVSPIGLPPIGPPPIGLQFIGPPFASFSSVKPPLIIVGANADRSLYVSFVLIFV